MSIKVDKSTLSKHKYVYMVYGEDHGKGPIVCERFPIIYLNSEYIYYLCKGDKNLHRVRTGMVYENVSTAINSKAFSMNNGIRNFLYNGGCVFTFSSVGSDEQAIAIINDINEESKIRRLERSIEDAKNCISAFSRYIDNYKANIEDCEMRIREKAKELHDMTAKLEELKKEIKNNEGTV